MNCKSNAFVKRARSMKQVDTSFLYGQVLQKQNKDKLETTELYPFTNV